MPSNSHLKNIPTVKLKAPKKKRNCKRIFLIVLIVFLVFVFLVIPSLTAASGIIKVPLLSKIFYHSKRPDVHFDIPDKNLEKINFKTLRNSKGVPYAVQATEKDLNAYLVSKATEKTDIIQEPIFLLHNDEIEFWAKIKRSIIDADLNVALKVRLKKGKISIELTRVKLGRLGIPARFLTSFSDEINQQLQQEVGKEQDVTLEKLTIKEGVMVIEGKARE